MRRAIVLARRGEGRVEPNPMVGCVIVRDARIIGEGYHRRYGGSHAEVEALKRCGRRARGATLYVTLEPCCHFGKTPPCVDALISAGIRKVVVALRDPNPIVSGRGLRKLKAAGIKVQTGVEAEAAARLAAPFATLMRLGRPYVIAKWAQDAHGGMTRPTGVSPWISCETSRRWAHRLRARVDAIIVGSGTVLRDDPMLTARGVVRKRVASRVVLDSRLRTPLESGLVSTAADVPTLVFTTPAMAKANKARRLAAKSVHVVGVRARRGALDLRAVLGNLAARGAMNVLVEGGPTLLAGFFEADLIDEANVFVAPRRRRPPTAENGAAPFRSRGLTRTTAGLTPVEFQARPSGRDIHYRIVLKRNHAPPGADTGTRLAWPLAQV